MTEYKGWTVLQEQALADFYNGKYSKVDYFENQYAFCGDEVYRFNNGFFNRCDYPIINNNWNNSIKPKDLYQFAAMDLLKQRNSKVKLICGVYGSGKDHLMFNQALSLIEKGDFDKIVFIRPNVTLANVPQIGYLPNGVEEKLAWTMAPLYDKVGGEMGIEQLAHRNLLEMVPLLFIRGRSFERSIVYVTEAQNIDSEIAKVLISRIGEGSELWLNGDYHNQTDNRIFDKDNGLVRIIDRLKGNELFGYVYLPNTHRGSVANLANLLD